MSSLPLLDTITGGYNNWLDAIRNNDTTLPGQIKANLNLLSAGAGAQTIFGHQIKLEVVGFIVDFLVFCLVDVFSNRIVSSGGIS